jgi:hypothetical protein
LTTPAPLQNKPPQNDQPSQQQIKEFTGNGKETTSMDTLSGKPEGVFLFEICTAGKAGLDLSRIF